jgi:hypothetical protein
VKRKREGKGEEEYRGGTEREMCLVKLYSRQAKVERGEGQKIKMEDLAKEGLIMTEKSVLIFHTLSQIFKYTVSHVLVIFLDH